MASLLSYALTNLADVKESLGIASSDTSWDNLIIRMINKATLAIQNYTGRHFKAADYEDEEYNGNGINQLVLNQRPIISITTLNGRDTSLNESDFTTVDSELYFANDSAGVLDLNFSTSGNWSKYTVSYRAGYETIPDDLAEACAALAAYYVTNADGSNLGVVEKREGQRMIKYASGSGSGANSFESILAGLGIDSIIDSYSNYPITGNKG